MRREAGLERGGLTETGFSGPKEGDYLLDSNPNRGNEDDRDRVEEKSQGSALEIAVEKYLVERGSFEFLEDREVLGRNLRRMFADPAGIVDVKPVEEKRH